MRKTFFLLGFTLFVVEGSFSQSDTAIRVPDSLRVWKKGGAGALNFSQVSFSNWAAGGENNLSNPIHKSDDKIDFTSKRGYKAGHVWYYAALLNFKSQFSPGYNYPNDSTVISDFMAPAYLLVSLGIDYKPDEHQHNIDLRPRYSCTCLY